MAVLVRTTIVFPGKRFQALKKLALKRKVSIGKLVNDAVDKLFFVSQKEKSFGDLKGLWQGHVTTEEDFDDIKKGLSDPRL